jgi:hypothetical protein
MDKNNELPSGNKFLVYSFAALMVICTVSLLFTYLNYHIHSRTMIDSGTAELPAANSQPQVNQNLAVMEGKPVEANQPNSNLQANTSPMESSKPEITESAQNPADDNFHPVAGENNTDPETQKKIEEKLVETRNFMQNRDFENAKRVLNEIANENKGTVWETQARKAIEVIDHPELAQSQSQENKALGNLREFQTCLASFMAENGKLPDITNLDSSREFFEKTCGSINKDFFGSLVKNILIVDNSFNYNIMFELNSGQKYFLKPDGITGP